MEVVNLLLENLRHSPTLLPIQSLKLVLKFSKLIDEIFLVIVLVGVQKTGEMLLVGLGPLNLEIY